MGEGVGSRGVAGFSNGEGLFLHKLLGGDKGDPGGFPRPRLRKLLKAFIQIVQILSFSDLAYNTLLPIDR